MKEAARVSSISRSGLYLLIRSGEIKSRSLRKRNAILGTRLINRDSLMDYIEAAGK